MFRDPVMSPKQVVHRWIQLMHLIAFDQASTSLRLINSQGTTMQETTSSATP